MKLNVVIFIFLLNVFSFANAQHSNIKFQNISTKNGLSQSNVICIIQDKKGFMWFGTRYGLNKYDGYNFEVYKKNEKLNSLSNNTIMDLLEDKEGNIWIATWGGGLNKFDPAKEKFYHYKFNPENEDGLTDNFINDVFEDKKGNIWIGTNAGGLNILDPKTESFKKFFHDKEDPESIGSNGIYDIFEDGKNNLWIGTEGGGLALFDRQKNKFKNFKNNPNNPKSISHNSVRKISEDSKGNLWIGTYGGGLNILNLGTEEFIHFKKDEKKPNSISHDYIYAIEEDDFGNIWIGTENGGLNIYQPKTATFHNYLHNRTDNMSLSSNSVYSIYKDKKGNIWVGTFSGGINFYNIDSRKFNHYKNNSSENSLSDNNVLAIYEDSEQSIWVGTDGGGLNLFNPKNKSFTHYKHNPKDPNSICGDYVLAIHEDSENNIWVGTWGSGLTVINKKNNQYTHFKHNSEDPQSLGSNNAWTIFEDKDKNIWVGTYHGGLSLYNKELKNFTTYKYDPNDSTSISSNSIYKILQDKDGEMWIGTVSGGLNHFNKKTGKFTRYLNSENPNSISNNMVSNLFQDSEGTIWVSTDAGLNKFDPKTKTFKVFTEEDGLPNDMVFGVLEDNQKNLWISTNRGLSKFNPKTLKFKNYSIADGLQHNEFKRQASYKSKSGLMYFGGINGFNEFDPESVANSSYDPPLIFTDFQIFNKRVPIADKDDDPSPLKKHISQTNEIILSHNESVILFEYASLNYTIEEKKKYAYILEGFDKSWNEVGTKRTTSYTNLDPGNYVFKVKGLNNEGEWSDNIASIKLTITPPYWKTWWFRIFVFLLFIGTVISGYKFRVNAISKQKAELEKQVKERTSEVVSQKEMILNQSEKLEDLFKEVTDSIRAAQNIQKSLLPGINYIKKCVPETFILNKPKDVVSGDFYWFDVVDDKIIFAVVDCTGHGVSGAFMSINGHHLLNQSIYGQENLVASEILDNLNSGIIKALHQKDAESHISDGMDVSLCIVDKKNKKIQYAGANSPLYLIRNNDLQQIKGNRFSVGLSVTGKVNKFTNNELDIMHGDIIYMFSDGYADQMGGEDGQTKFMYNRFRNLLINIHKKDMDDQVVELEQALNQWRGCMDQIDDIMIIGFRV